MDAAAIFGLWGAAKLHRRSFSTENRTTFKGHNVVEHPAPQSCKAVEDEYKQPEVKFETETSQKRDYRPIDLAKVETAKAVLPPTTMAPVSEAHFDGRTMNNEFFKNWGASPRIRYGDFHENRPYIPPTMPFEGESITKSSFVKKKMEPVTLYKPAERPNSKANAKVNYSTSYTEEFQKKQVRMCRAQMYLMQQELKRRQRAAAALAAKPISVK
nr:hypothetical protein BaRGS_000963 [Batillaria attramentaria]